MTPYWLYFKANACAREERYEEAAEFASRSLEARPGYSGAWITLANALGQLGHVDEAGAAMDRALRADPEMTPEHLATRTRILAGGSGTVVEKALAGLESAGLL